ncbi:MAG: hypothetical protein ACI9WU_003991, partial [Myxococcota bacterium]
MSAGTPRSPRFGLWPCPGPKRNRAHAATCATLRPGVRRSTSWLRLDHAAGDSLGECSLALVQLLLVSSFCWCPAVQLSSCPAALSVSVESHSGTPSPGMDRLGREGRAGPLSPGGRTGCFGSVIRGFKRTARPARELSGDELRAWFGQPDGRVFARQIARNLLLDLLDRIRAAPEDWRFEGGIRDLFHVVLEPVLARLAPDERGPSEYVTFADELNGMVQHQRLVTYRELNVTDRAWENRRIGDRRPDVMVIREKLGLVRLLRRVHRAHGVSTLALNGYPNAVTMEYTAAHVLEALGTAGLPSRIHVIALTDWDPYGHNIARVFGQMLLRFGVGEVQVETPLEPELLSAPERALARYPLRRPKSTHRHVFARWLAAHFGDGTRPYGLALDA